MVAVVPKDKKNESCYGCKHLVVKEICRGIHTASCGDSNEKLIPHEWNGTTVTINGIGGFCKGKEDHKV